jgi:hypothetical protein
MRIAGAWTSGEGLSPEVLRRKQIIEQHARPGESWQDAEFRLFGATRIPSPDADDEAITEQPKIHPWSAITGAMLIPFLFNPDADPVIPRPFYAARTTTFGNGASLTYRGKELRSQDRAVWLYIVERMARRDAGLTEFSAVEFCATADWDSGKASQGRLRDCLLRLQSCSLAVRHGDCGAAVPLLSAFWWTDARGDRDNAVVRRYTTAVPIDLVEIISKR